MFDLRWPEPSTILCIGAHSDDIEIGAGATLLRMVREYPRARIVWVVLAAGGVRGEEAAEGGERRGGAVGETVGVGDEHGVAFVPGGARVGATGFEGVAADQRGEARGAAVDEGGAVEPFEAGADGAEGVAGEAGVHA